MYNYAPLLELKPPCFWQFEFTKNSIRPNVWGLWIEMKNVRYKIVGTACFSAIPKKNIGLPTCDSKVNAHYSCPNHREQTWADFSKCILLRSKLELHWTSMLLPLRADNFDLPLLCKLNASKCADFVHSSKLLLSKLQNV